MKKTTLLILSLLMIISSAVFAHSGKARFHVIIDTDGGPDDLRAICMILASPEFEVLAITTSDGLLRPEEVYVKVKALLKDFGHEGIPVGYGKTVNKNVSQCHSVCSAVNWGNENGIQLPQFPNAIELLKTEIESEDEKVIIICMGPMTNMSEIIADANLKSQIDKILWYSDDARAKSGFNYELDKTAAKAFIESDIQKQIVSSKDNPELLLTFTFLEKIAEINNPYAKKIAESHNCTEIAEKIKNENYKIWDELLAISLLKPELFEILESTNSTTYLKPKQISTDSIFSSYLEILNSKNSNENKVFKTFPLSPELYSDDVRAEMNEIIKRHGITEFRAGVLTNELHGHLGIYAIIGVKMGIRVRQYFNISVDDIFVTSYAGSKPPVSCMNDGLQVSTGGTIGHGLISISDEELRRPQADFRFKNKTVSLRLKDEYWNMIKTDVKSTIDRCGNLTPAYWEELRGHAIRYWKEFDRMEIFEIREM
jgi:pyrimidine-specific ribonucleoside hydrolase